MGKRSRYCLGELGGIHVARGDREGIGEGQGTRKVIWVEQVYSIGGYSRSRKVVEKTEDDDFKGAMGCGCGRDQIQCNTGK